MFTIDPEKGGGMACPDCGENYPIAHSSAENSGCFKAVVWTIRLGFYGLSLACLYGLTQSTEIAAALSAEPTQVEIFLGTLAILYPLAPEIALRLMKKFK